MVCNLGLLVEPRTDGETLSPRLFIPGDEVKGEVVLILTEDENIDTILIDLKGKCKTKIVIGGDRNKQTHRYERNFHTQQRVLFQGPFKMRADTYQYPFAFQIPETFNYTNYEFRDQNWAQTYSTSGPKPLPPTCLGPYHTDFSSEISYHLTARVPKTNLEDSYVLNFSPSRRILDPAPLPKKVDGYNCSTYHRHYRLTAGGRCRALTTREAMTEAFRHSAATSTVNFTFSATAPTAIVIGRSYTVDFILTSPDEATGNIMPSFTLKSWTLILKTRTDIRIPGKGSDHQKLLEDLINISSGTLNSSIRLNRPLRVANLFPEGKIYAPPTFECMAVKRSYDLDLKVAVECLGETSSFKVKWPDVTLYPAKVDAGVREAIQAIEIGTAQLGIRQQGGLPAYDASAGPQVEEELPSYGVAVQGSAA